MSRYDDVGKLTDPSPNETEPLLPVDDDPPDHQPQDTASVEWTRRETHCFLAHFCWRFVASAALLAVTSGIFIGWAPVKNLAISQGMFFDRCSPNSTANATSLMREPVVCHLQLQWINSVFQFAAFAFNLLGVLIGTFSDLHHVLFYFIAVFGFTASVVLFGATLSLFRFFDRYFFWVAHLSYTGIAFFAGSLHLSWLKLIVKLPEHLSIFAGICYAILGACFDASSFLFQLLEFVSNSVGGRVFATFGVYAAIMFLFAFGLGFFLNPPRPKRLVEMEKRAQEEEDPQKGNCLTRCCCNRKPRYDGEETGEGGARGKRETTCKRTLEKVKGTFLTFLSFTLPFCDHLRDGLEEEEKTENSQSPPSDQQKKKRISRGVMFILAVLWKTFSMTQLYFYLSTVYDNALSITGSETRAKSYDSLFGYLYPSLGFASSIPGLILYWNNASVFYLLVMHTIWSSISPIPQMDAVLVTYVFYSLARAFSYGFLFKYISVEFPASWFGILNCLVLFLANLFTPLQMAFNDIVYQFLNHEFWLIYAILGGFGIFAHFFLLASAILNWCTDGCNFGNPFQCCWRRTKEREEDEKASQIN